MENKKARKNDTTEKNETKKNIFSYNSHLQKIGAFTIPALMLLNFAWSSNVTPINTQVIRKATEKAPPVVKMTNTDNNSDVKKILVQQGGCFENACGGGCLGCGDGCTGCRGGCGFVCSSCTSGCTGCQGSGGW